MIRRLALLVVVGAVAASCGGGKTKSATSPPPSPSSSESTLPPNTIELSSLAFSPGLLTVTSGTTVTWHNLGARTCVSAVGESQPCPHNVVSVDDLFNSHPECKGIDTPCMAPGGTFQYTFSTPGTYLYYCYVHARCSGKTCEGMYGNVVVT